MRREWMIVSNAACSQRIGARADKAAAIGYVPWNRHGDAVLRRSEARRATLRFDATAAELTVYAVSPAPPPWTPPAPLSAAPFIAPTPPPAPPPSAEIRVGENGRIHGVDGMFDQIASALARHAEPMFARLAREDVLPAIRQDAALQQRMGSAAGEALGRQIQPYLLVGVGALSVLAGLALYRHLRTRRSTPGARQR